jgi:DNA mismatch repair ATPase MutS
MERLGHPRFSVFERLLDEAPPAVDDRLRWLFALLGALGLASLVAPLIWGGWGFVAVTLPIVLLNFFIHFRWKDRSAYYADAYFYLGRLIAAGHELARLADSPSLARTAASSRLAALGEACARLEPLRRRTRFFAPPRWFSGDLLDTLGEYFRIISLGEVNAFLFVNNHIARHLGDVRELHARLGEIDALQATAGWRRGLPAWCAADLDPPPGAPSLEAEGLYHPLVDNAVANAIRLADRGAVFSGTNMSGKSTFLRALAVNQILAQSLGLACAGRFAARPRLVASSMRRSDDLETGVSLYLAEAQRLLAMVRLAEIGAPVLLAIDEILSGTNSHERVRAGAAILRHLASGGFDCLVLAATHDLEIPAALDGLAECWHFTDQVGPGGLAFDYRLKPGIVRERNAIKLFDHLGFPEAVMAGLRE